VPDWGLPILDTHTHLSGSESGESAARIIACLNDAGVDKAFVFAPLVDVHTWQLANQHLDDLRAHNDYCADVCSGAPERLLGFCVLNPVPRLARGSLKRAVDLMVEEAGRCYHELGLRGVKIVPGGWYPNDRTVVPLYEAIAELGMYVVFHVGIFLDGREGSYCRPTFYEAVHRVPELKAQLAHVGWPWVDECVAVLEIETMLHGTQPESAARYQLRADVSFGPPDDWQLSTWQRALDSLPPSMLCYGSDAFWPTDAEKYLEQYLRPQLGLFEVAVTNGHLAAEGSPARARMRKQIFCENAWAHWQGAVRKAQRPRAASSPVQTPRASGACSGRHLAK
jgi:predicted TIM-barrel fold metal-dependent hydrolase